MSAAVVRCQSNLHRAAHRNGQPERNSGAVQIALAPYNRGYQLSHSSFALSSSRSHSAMRVCVSRIFEELR